MKGGNGVSAANEVTLRQAPENCSPDGECVIPLTLFAPLPPFNHNFKKISCQEYTEL